MTRRTILTGLGSPATRSRKPWTKSVTALMRGPFRPTGLLGEQQDDDEEQEGHDVLPLGADEGGAVVLGDAEDEAAEQRTTHVADAAEDRRGEGLDAEDEAGVVAGDPDLEQVEHRGTTGHDPADEEGDPDDPVPVDAHQRRRLGVLRHGPDAAAEPGAPDELVEHD